MKHFVVIIFGLIILQNSFSQTKNLNEQYKDTAPRTSPIFWIFNIDYDRLLNLPSNVKQEAPTPISAGLTFMYDYRFNNKQFGIAPGLGFLYSSYSTNARMVNYNNQTFFEVFPDSVILHESSFNTLSITMPIEFRYLTKLNKKNNNLGISTGFKLGYIVYDRTYYTINKDSNSIDAVRGNIPNLATFCYGVISRIYYRTLNMQVRNVYGFEYGIQIYYKLSDFFTKNNNYQMNSCAFGASVAFIFN